MNRQYIYHPLPPIDRHERVLPFSRLIRLFAGEGHSPLRAALVIVNLEQCVRYEALSYVWGAEPPRTQIEIEGCYIPIRPNLQNALQNLRLPSQDRYLWIDALCINQADVVEKTRQVQYMRQVYRHAARSIMWLGMKSPGIELAFQSVTRVAEMISTITSGLPPSPSWDMDVYWDLIADAIPVSSHATTHALRELFEREFFVRIWCVQELVASRWAIAKCEELEVPFYDVTALARTFHHVPRLTPGTRPLKFWSRLLIAHQLRRWGKDRTHVISETENSAGSLLFLLEGAREFKATDPRDKLFALFGISNEVIDPVLGQTQSLGDRDVGKTLELTRKVFSTIRKHMKEVAPQSDALLPDALKPNYSKSCLEIYRDFTRHQIWLPPRALHVLHHVDHHQAPGTHEFPSWVPKWFETVTCQIAPITLYFAGINDQNHHFYAQMLDYSLRKGSVQPNTLSIAGFLVDQVTAISEPLDFTAFTDDGVERADLNRAGFERAWQSLFNFPLFPRYDQKYRSGEPLDLAFYLTVAMGASGPSLGTYSQILEFNRDVTRTSRSRTDVAILEVLMRADVTEFMLDYYTPRGFSHHCPERVAAMVGVQTQGDKSRYESGAGHFGQGRRMFLTQNGYLGLGPRIMQPGDQVCVLYGGRFPFVVRPVEDNHHYQLIGACYIHDHDIMWGEHCKKIMTKDAGCQFREQTFHII